MPGVFICRTKGEFSLSPIEAEEKRRLVGVVAAQAPPPLGIEAARRSALEGISAISQSLTVVIVLDRAILAFAARMGVPPAFIILRTIFEKGV